MGGVVHVDEFVMDFEAGAWEAVKEVFHGKQVKGCSFHWGQAVFKKVAEAGLKPTYAKKEGVFQFIRKLLALPFLPAGHIEGAFGIFKDLTNTPELKDVINYIDRTWLSSTHWSVRQWSVYGQSVRTNNDDEGWHRRLNGKAGKANLQLYVLVPLLRRKANMVPIQHQLVSEEQLTRCQRMRYMKMQGEISNLWTKYEEKKVTTSDF